MAAETWYILEDDTAAHPRDVHRGKDDLLVHKDGRKVAYAPHGPRSRSVDPEVEMAKAKAPKPTLASKQPAPESKPTVEEAPAAAAAGTKTRDLTAEKPKGGYKTRDTKAD